MAVSSFLINIQHLYKKKDDRLPGEGNGGMEKLASAGNVSMLVSARFPPLIMRPAKREVYEIQEAMVNFH